MKNIIYIVLDGLGDLPIPELDNKTPLEAAYTPNLDNLASRGRTGLVYTVGKKIAPESDIAVISILGYDAHKYYTGRGPLESFAEGLEVKDGDLAFRANFATAGKDDKILDRRVGRNLSTEEATELAELINRKVKLTKANAEFKFKNTIGHRAILVIYPKEGKLSGAITNTDPAYEKEGVFGVAKEKYENKILECKPVEDYKDKKEAQVAAELTNEFTKKAREVLNAAQVNKNRISEEKLPANIILLRDAGDSLPKFPKLPDLYKMKVGCFVEMPVERGIALLTGMEIIPMPARTDNLGMDYREQAESVAEVIKDFQMLYIHIKGPDEPAHDGNAQEKKRIIELIDRNFFGHLLPKINLEEIILAVTSDHSTPCLKKAHSDDPVPLLVYSKDLTPDGAMCFGERDCQRGSLGIMKGTAILPLLVNLAK